MKEKTILNKIKETLGIEVKLEQMKLDNGTVVEADNFEPNAEIFVVSDAERIPLPSGDYKLEDGRALIIAQDGIIAEIKDVQAPEAPAQDMPVAAEEVTPVAKKVVETSSKETHFTKEEMLAEIEKLRAEFSAKLDELKLSKEEVKTELKKEVEKVELEEVKPIKHSPEAEVVKKTPILYSQNRTYGTKELVFKKLFNN